LSQTELNSKEKEDADGNFDAKQQLVKKMQMKTKGECVL